MVKQTSEYRVTRFETEVELEGQHFHFRHKGVVYHVKSKGDTETIVLAENHRWRDGYLMVVYSDKDMDHKEAHKLINDYVNRYLMCQSCYNEWDGATTFRIDIKGGLFVRVLCAYCDPTVHDLVKPYDYQEVVRSACKHA